MNEHTSLEKYTSHTLFKRVVCERWVGDWTDCNILTPSSSDYSSTSFSFCWAAQPGVTEDCKPSVSSWFSLPLTATWTPTNWLQLTQAVWHRVIWLLDTHLLFVGVAIAPNSTRPQVKVIPWYLRPDAPVSWLTAGSKVTMLHLFP